MSKNDKNLGSSTITAEAEDAMGLEMSMFTNNNDNDDDEEFKVELPTHSHSTDVGTKYLREWLMDTHHGYGVVDDDPVELINLWHWLGPECHGVDATIENLPILRTRIEFLHRYWNSPAMMMLSFHQSSQSDYVLNLLKSKAYVLVLHVENPGFCWLARVEGEHVMETPIRILDDGSGFKMEHTMYSTMEELLDDVSIVYFEAVVSRGGVGDDEDDDGGGGDTIVNVGFRKIHPLGYGSFGEVHKVVRILDDDDDDDDDDTTTTIMYYYAMKHINLSRSTTGKPSFRSMAEQEAILNREIEALRYISKHSDPDDDSILRLFAYTKSRDCRQARLLMSLIQGPELYDWIGDDSEPTEWSDIVRVLAALVECVRHLHRDLKIAHLDLKPSNFILEKLHHHHDDQDDDDDGGLCYSGRAIVVDYGFACPLGDRSSNFKFASGTSGYRSEELKRGLTHASNLCAVDIYALGTTMLQIIYHKRITSGGGDGGRRRGHRSRHIRKFIEHHMLNPNPANRCTITDVGEFLRDFLY